MTELNEIERGQLCQSTIESLYEATGGLKHFPGLLKKIIQNKAWERRASKGKVIQLANLRELITSQPIDGWGEDPKKIEAIIKDDSEVLTLYREAMKHQGERTDFRNNITEVEVATTCNNITGGNVVTGTAKSYTLSRLQRESPELFTAVCNKELSANAAAIKAGFRSKTISIPVDKPEAVAKSLRKHMSKKDFDKFVKLITAN